MHKLLIIDDTACQKELDEFLHLNENGIILYMEEEEFSRRIENLLNDLNHLYKMQKILIIRTNSGVRKLIVADIMYVQRFKEISKSLIFLNDGTNLVALSNFHAIKKDLTRLNFVPVNDTFFINTDFIEQYIHEKEKYVVMENGEKISVSSEYESFLLQFLESWQ